MDCPEIETEPEYDGECMACMLRDLLGEKIDMVENAILCALSTDALRKHPQRRANKHLEAALDMLDDIWSDILCAGG